MESLSELLRNYKTESDQIWFVRKLETNPDTVVDEFYLHLLTTDTSTEVKIEILRTLEIRSVNLEIRDTVARSIVGLLEAEDEVVQQYSATALRNYWDAPAVLTALRLVASDPQRDEDVRFNALDSMTSHLDDDDYLAAFKSLSQLDDYIGDEARERLEL